MEKYTATAGEAWRLGEGPFIFSGVPPICVGELELVNHSEDKVKVRAIPVVGHQDETVASLGLGKLRVGARLAPRDRMRVSAHFLVDPRTPSGRYTADLACAGQREPVVIHVFESLGLEVEPGTIELRGAGGDLLRTPLVVTNRGNVTETVPELRLVFLEERNWIGRSLVFALRESTEDEGHEAFLDRVVRELRATVARPARVTLSGTASEIRPGDKRELELEIALPAELIKGRTYTGSTPFMSSKLFFKVECNGTSTSTKRRPR
ncbi:MAG: hypothetical protein ACRDQ2_07620 [Gaiellales bacterium]